MTAIAGLRLRPQESGDRPALLALFAEARAAEHAALGWPESQLRSYLHAQFKVQQLDYARRFPGARFDVVEIGTRTVGRFYVARRGDDFVIVDIIVARHWRGRGIATRLIRDLQREAGDGEIRLHVRPDNPACSLYARLGFVAVRRDGPALEMCWTAGPGGGS